MGVNPQYVDVKLGFRRKSCKGQAAMRHYANQPVHPL